MLETFTDLIGTAVQNALPWIMAGVAAGAIVWFVLIGVRLAMRGFQRMQLRRDDPDLYWDLKRDNAW